VPEKLETPLKWKTPKRVFVNSMSDLFQVGVPTRFISRVGRVMQRAHWHTYQVLTKRHERLRALLTDRLEWMARLPHVWFGVSVEDRRHGLPRIPALQATPASVRFLSIEPLLEDLGPLDLTGIDWVIVGGESGHQARPMREDWVLSIRDQCRRAGVAFFFKQWGGVRKHETGRLLGGRTYDEFPVMDGSPGPYRGGNGARAATASR
jgi:protein gp37